MDENIKAFLRVLDPSDNATGGGTASAVAGAMGAALVAMVARLSTGGRGTGSDAFFESIADEAGKLSEDLFAGGSRDSLAFDRVSSALKLPKASPEEKAARLEALQDATIHAAAVPLENAALCRRVLDLREEIEGKFNPNAASDLQCAGLLARAGLAGCLCNVRINLPGIRDAALAGEMTGRAKDLEKAL
ncbi:MAG: cyclodeaminase/cyclohydrolase family protein [Deltaproteobacteria bacterium]|nr:cyclodeaminase/cyclohydrolase family protein [Deltaproteobacteria bacterium]